MQLAPNADAQRQFAAKSDFSQSGILSLQTHTQQV
jgi:hypothetical protein